MAKEFQDHNVDEESTEDVIMVASGEPSIVTDEHDIARSKAEGQECQQLFVKGLSLKVFDGSDKFPGGTVEGLANAFGNVDFQGEVMKRGAFKRTIQAFKKAKKGLPLMDNHRIFGGTDAVIGNVIDLKETSEGLFFKAYFSSVPAAQAVRTKIHEGILNSLSIGFSIVKKKLRKDGILELLEVKLREVSVVVFPANELATVSDVKSAVSRIEPCEDADREFDEAMAVKRWRDYCGGDVPQTAWSDEHWAKYAGAFTIVDNNAATQAAAFKGLVLDVIDGTPVIVRAAVERSIEAHGKSDFLTGLLAKFETSTVEQSDDDEAEEPETEEKAEEPETETKEVSNKFDTLARELQQIKQARAMRRLRKTLEAATK